MTRRRPSLGAAKLRGMELLVSSEMVLENGRCVDVIPSDARPEIDAALDYIRDLVVWANNREQGGEDHG